MSRIDGRADQELRPIEVTYERLNRVDGSARFGFGQTQFLASVSGPIEARLALESPSQATLDVHVRPLPNVPSTDAKFLAAVLKSVFAPSLLLSHHPRTSIQIVGQSLCGNETGSGMGSVGRGWNASLIATLINAVSAALVSANSVPMKGVVCAVGVGKLLRRGDGQPLLVLDPSEDELPLLVGGGCFAFLFSSTISPSLSSDIPPHSLVWTNYANLECSYGEDELASARKLAEEGAAFVWRKFKNSVTDLEVRINSPEAPKRAKKVQKSTIVSPVDDAKMEIW